MIVYTVHEPMPPAPTPEARAESVVFIREGFSWFGFLFHVFWLLFNRLWLEAIAAFVLLIGLGYLLVALGAGQGVAGGLGILLNFIVGFEGNDLRRWKLERCGYDFIGPVTGRSFEDAERRFFLSWYPVISGGAPLPRKPWSSDQGNAPGPAGGLWASPAAIGTLPGAGV
jgi:hypothetical protein